MFPSKIYMWQWNVINSSNYVHCSTGMLIVSCYFKWFLICYTSEWWRILAVTSFETSHNILRHSLNFSYKHLMLCPKSACSTWNINSLRSNHELIWKCMYRFVAKIFFFHTKFSVSVLNMQCLRRKKSENVVFYCSFLHNSVTTYMKHPIVI